MQQYNQMVSDIQKQFWRDSRVEVSCTGETFSIKLYNPDDIEQLLSEIAQRAYTQGRTQAILDMVMSEVD